MCFLKCLKPLDQIQVEKEIISRQISHPQVQMENDDKTKYFNQFFNSKRQPKLAKDNQMMLILANLVNYNSVQIKNIENKLTENEVRLFNSIKDADSLIEQKTHTNSCLQLENSSTDEEYLNDHKQNAGESLVTQLFGKRKYQYKLQLQEQFPTTIFKERNLNISVNLLNQHSQKIMNSNMVHLCLGVCDNSGQWITENRGGQTFMKGKTEVEMYHGEGSFLKIYPRDVTRSYADGKLNFIIYSKPSTLKFSTNSSQVQKIVNSNLIEPLLIKDITIKAKKKE